MTIRKIKVSALPEATTLVGLNVLGVDGSTNGSVKVPIDLLKGNNLELQKTSTHVQWRAAGSTWVNLVALIDITDTVSMQATSTELQWKAESGTWQTLITLTTLHQPAIDAATSAQASASSAAADKTTISGYKDTVAADKATVTTDKGIVSADKATVIADMAIVAADKATVISDKGTVAADKATVAADKAIVIADKATVAADKSTTIAAKDTTITKAAEALASKNAAAVSETNAAASAASAANKIPEAPNDGLPYIRKSAAWTGLYSIMEDMLSYGISWDSTVTTAAKTRIGNMSFHATLPIQSRIKGCILKDDGTVYKYLPTTGAWDDADLTGTNGQVMIEIPSHYRIFTTNGNAKTARISFDPLPGYHLVPKTYISAYEASIQRSTGKLCSVKNTAVDFRGGNNQSTWDGTNKSVLGRPVTNITRTELRTAARLRATGTAWNMLDYNSYNALYWLYLIEYANTNSQLAFNAAKDSNGYAQGGLGNGVTDWVSADWNTFNGYYPFVPCGHSDSLGNASGEVSYPIKDVDNVTVLKTVYVNRYRGVENPFGHIYKFLDGCNLEILTDAGGGTSKLYVATNPANFNDADYSRHTYRGLLARTSGYILKMLIGEFGELLPTDVGAGSTTGWCDYFYTDPAANNGLRVVLAGGAAHIGAYAGFGYSDTYYAPSAARALVGSRLCFLPA